MEEVVYQFLLQTAGYPRAAIISDTSILFPESSERPSYAIVDPDTARPLAVVHVVGAVDAAGLYAESASADANKKSLRPAHVQGFVIRIDFKGKTDKEKIQFYRAKDNGDLYPLSASTFPDLDSLRVSAKLRDAKAANQSSSGSVSAVAVAPMAPKLSAEQLMSLSEEERLILEGRGEYVPPIASETPVKKSRSKIWLGLLLIVIAIADLAGNLVLGTPLLKTTHVLLIVGAVLAFVLG